MNDTLFPVSVPADCPDYDFHGKVGTLRYVIKDDGGITLIVQQYDCDTAVQLNKPYLDFLVELGVEVTPIPDDNTLPFSINRASNRIAMLSRRGAGNIVVAHPTTVARFVGLPLRPFTIVGDDALPQDTIVVGYVGIELSKGTGAIWDIGVVRLADGRVITDSDSQKYYHILKVNQ